MTNPYLNFNNRQDQMLIENLVDEAIQIHGMEAYYIVRKLVNVDELLGEDRLSKFQDNYRITGYFENINQLDGSGPIFERAGMFLDYGMSFTVSKREFQKCVGQYGKQATNRPTEGDLIYIPMTDQLYEVKFVNDKEPFGQLGKFYTYKLHLALFQYASEQIDTKVDDIDAFEALKTLDVDHPERSFWGAIQSVNIVSAGSGYTEQPTIQVQCTSGSGALLIPIINDSGEITEVTVMDGGEGYPSSSEVYLNVVGDCTTPARLTANVQVQIENAADKWATNTFMADFAEDNLTEFDRDNPFNEMSASTVSSNIEG